MTETQHAFSTTGENPVEDDLLGTPSREDSYDSGTIYDDVRSELSQAAVLEPYPLRVLSRPKFRVVYDPNIDFDTLKTWIDQAQKNAGSGRTRRLRRQQAQAMGQDVDPITFARLVLANQCMQIEYTRNDGKEWTVLTDSEGEWTFVSREFQEMLGATTTVDAIHKMYGSEGLLIQTAQAVVAEAGYSEIDLESGDSPLT